MISIEEWGCFSQIHLCFHLMVLNNCIETMQRPSASGLMLELCSRNDDFVTSLERCKLAHANVQCQAIVSYNLRCGCCKRSPWCCFSSVLKDGLQCASMSRSDMGMQHKLASENQVTLLGRANVNNPTQESATNTTHHTTRGCITKK